MRGQLTATQLNERKNMIILREFGKLFKVNPIKTDHCPFIKQIKASPFLVASAFKK